jgi:molybdopterin-guanine dinucleotide biosynthesis adapter protein
MKAVGIIGYKKSGKTTLGVRLAAELAQKGLVVGVIKHTVEDIIDLPATDSAKYCQVSDFVAVLNEQQAEIILKGKQEIDEIMKYFNGDILLVEGFKDNRTFPKIVCLREESERKDLCNGLEIATVSFKKELGDYDIMDDAHCRILADLIMEKGFILPALDCGHCAYTSCEALAKAIVSGTTTLEECVSLNPQVSIKVDSKDIALNPFTADFCKSTIFGMLSTLKGYKKGKITIEIP